MKGKRLQGLLTVAVFLLFAVCTLLVLLASGGVYQRLVEQGEQRHSRFTAAQYLTTRVHQSQGVRVENFEGCQALALEETIEQEQYLTRIYLYDGCLWELFTLEGADCSREDGEKLFSAQDFAPAIAGDLLTISLDGERLYLHVPTP